LTADASLLYRFACIAEALAAIPAAAPAAVLARLSSVEVPNWGFSGIGLFGPPTANKVKGNRISGNIVAKKKMAKKIGGKMETKVSSNMYARKKKTRRRRT
jgi:hypothetical protein